MILTCPSCGTKFRIPDDALGDTGRKLRCAACKHVWFEASAKPEPFQAPVAEEASPPPDESENTAPQPESPSSQDQTGPAATAGAITDTPCVPQAQANQEEAVEPDPEPELPAETPAPVAAVTDGLDSGADLPSGTQDAAPPVDAQTSAVYTPQDTNVLTPHREPEPEPPGDNDNIGLASDTIKPKPRDGEARTEPTFDISRVVAPDSAPEEKPRKKRGGGAKAFLLFLLLVVAVGFGLFEFRNQIMRNIPATIDYYEMADLVGPPNSVNLEYRDAAFSVDVQGNHSLLIVSGRIVNTGNKFQRLPALRAEILDVSGAVVLHWSFEAAAAGLGPDDQTTYRATYPDPPRGDDLFDIFMTFEDVR